MNKNILYILDDPTPNGCAYVRNIMPAEGLSTLGWKPHFLPIPENRFDYSIVNFSRLYQKIGIMPFVEKIRATGAKLVYDTDDLIDRISADNPFQAAFNKQDLINGYRYFLKTADLITVTTESLKEEISKQTNKPIVVIPNAIREFNIRAGRNKRVRICYTGSTTHYPDFDFVLDVILELQKKYNFTFVTLGIGINDWFENNYKDLPAVLKPYLSCKEKIKQIKNYEHHDPVPIMGNDQVIGYHEKLRDMNITIGLCPLHDDQFTRSKSAVKFYDWASVGTVTMATKCVVYEDCNYTAKYRFSDWKNKLERLIADNHLRNEVLKEQMEYVAENRHIDVVKHQWDEAYKKLLN